MGRTGVGAVVGTRRAASTLSKAVLAVAAATGAVFGFTTAVASATTAVTPTVTLNAIPFPSVPFGSESQTFTGRVTGPSTDGFPTTGTVTVDASNGTTLCTASWTAGAGNSRAFTCTSTTSKLPASSYTVHASYSGGASSNPTFTFNSSTSATQSLRVTTPETTTISLNPITSTVAHGFESQTFSGTVTGQTGDGFPSTGTVTVVASNGTTLCTGVWAAGRGISRSYTCTSTTSKLAAGSYTVHAKYSGGASSTSRFNYNASTSSPRALTVVTPTPETTSVTLNAITSTVIVGSEAQTFTGTVTGKSGDGFPKGTVSVKTGTGKVLCTATLTSATSFTSSFSCAQSTSALTAGAYAVHSHYTGGASSNVLFEYTSSTSATRMLTVVNGTTTTTAMTLNFTSRTAGAETSEVFTVTVTGQSGHGYPKGTVTVKATTGTTLCSTSTRASGTTISSKFTCSPGASALVAGAYKLTATYTPTASRSSSTSGVFYAGSASSKASFSVTAGVVTTSSLSLSSPSKRSGAETSEVFTVTVTGKSGDGYPKGTVKVKTGATLLCTTATSSSHTTFAATFACSPRASALVAGTYSVVATYTPSTPSSSTSSVAYAGSTSSAQTFTVTVVSSRRIFGATPDATAAAELETVYPGSSGSCPGTSSNRPVVLATDAHFPDALAASYLAKWLGTGMLLTPTSSMTSATLTALRVEGITHVYVVGGPLAVSTAVVSQIQGTNAYQCGGTVRTSSHMTVTRISGTTQYTTAADIARTPGQSFVGSFNLQGAYSLYNDTTGKSSAVPAAGSLHTAILASGAEFQDAEASATLAYADDLPLLLTTPTALSSQALSAITTLGISQVILMGGPLAVSTAVVTALVSHHVSVLRVAGLDYTDTAGQLAGLELGSATGHKGLAWTPTGGVTIAQGAFYTDGLAGAVVAANGGTFNGSAEPMLLTLNPTTVGARLASFLGKAGSQGIDADGTPVSTLTILGGPLAVTTAVVSSMEADL